MPNPAPVAYTVTRQRIPEEIVPGKRLGRHYHYDSRSAAYPYLARAEAELAAALHARRIPILDQGNVGSCTAEAEVGCCGSDPFYATMPAGVALNQPYAYSFYSDEEVADGFGPYPPNDQGSDGTTAGKVAKKRGLISGYTHASDVTTMAQALQAGPVIIGINWYDSFDTPASNGTISISSGAQVRGGHEVVVRGVDPTGQMFNADNSWGTSWGDRGSFQFSWATMERLLGEGGDCTVSVPLSQPAPTPVPADPDAALWAVAGPWCAQTRTRPDLVTLKAALETWHTATG